MMFLNGWGWLWCLEDEDVQHSHKEMTTTLSDYAIKPDMRDKQCSSKVSNVNSQLQAKANSLFHTTTNSHVHTALFWKQQHINEKLISWIILLYVYESFVNPKCLTVSDRCESFTIATAVNNHKNWPVFFYLRNISNQKQFSGLVREIIELGKQIKTHTLFLWSFSSSWNCPRLRRHCVNNGLFACTSCVQSLLKGTVHPKMNSVIILYEFHIIIHILKNIGNQQLTVAIDLHSIFFIL